MAHAQTCFGLIALSWFLSGLAAPCARAQEASTLPSDKTAYTLFNPTPLSAMREMVTDRPDVTESPVTVDAGHFQAEFSYFEYDRNNDRNSRSDSIAVLPANLKVGLLNNVDLQFVFTPYVNERVKSEGFSKRSQGFGDDTELRLKINFWGNDPPPEGWHDPWHGTAFGIMPFIKFPTGSGDLSNDHVEGGLILPLAISLPGGFDLGTMAEFDFSYYDAKGGYGVNFVHSITLDHDIPGVPKLGGYIEYVGIAPCDTGSTYQAIASFGLTYTVNENLILDCGGTAGLSRAANDFTVFVGTSIRF